MNFFNFFTKNYSTLYVSRPLMNHGELHAWAISQGFKMTLSDMHTTIAYSQIPVKWSKFTPETNTLRIPATGARIEQFGEAIVLTFVSPDLQNRWGKFINGGCHWDHPSYHPHITISYHKPEQDINNMKPFNGLLIFGPEKFTPLNMNWKDKAKNSEY